MSRDRYIVCRFGRRIESMARKRGQYPPIVAVLCKSLHIVLANLVTASNLEDSDQNANLKDVF